MFTFTLFFFCLGLIIGSFLNVVIYRYNTGRSVGGRSGCLSCGKKLEFWELVPVFSWIFLGGKCSNCKTKISWQYPLVELSTATLFALLTFHFQIPTSYFLLPTLNFLLFLIIISILVVIFVYDIKHKIIPDALVFSFAGLALLFRLLETNFSNLQLIDWFNLFSGLIFFVPFFLLWVVSNGMWIGLGDGKLALGIGWMLGFVNGVSAIILSFWIGAVVASTFILIDRLKERGKHITMKTEVPFAPFMILGALIAFFYPMDLFSLNFLFNL